MIGPVDADFMHALFAEDELGAVIRAHIMIEAQVNDIVDSLAFDPKALPRLRFEQNVRLMVALGASHELLEPLIELGRIRNAFSHRIDTNLTIGMIDKWLLTFSDDDRAMMDRAIEKTCVDLKKPVASLGEHNAKSKFILAAVCLRQILRQMQAELDARKSASVRNQ